MIVDFTFLMMDIKFITRVGSLGGSLGEPLKMNFLRNGPGRPGESSVLMPNVSQSDFPPFKCREVNAMREAFRRALDRLSFLSVVVPTYLQAREQHSTSLEEAWLL